jgi:ubiquinone/menaquinone biosynthesis C-methylase UbiE
MRDPLPKAPEESVGLRRSPSEDRIEIPHPRSLVPFTGERFVPGLSGEIEHEHYHRYFFALGFVAGKRVLDVASGEGYGSALLAASARSVVGVEIDEESVRLARENYRFENLEFRIGDCRRLPLADGSCDVVVSFETIEHIGEQTEFVAEMRRVLCPEGLLILSSPIRGNYSPDQENPYHVKELSQQELLDLLKPSFPLIRSYVQVPTVGSAILENEPSGGSRKRETIVYERKEPELFLVGPPRQFSPYLVLLASSVALPASSESLLQDRNSRSHLIGSLETASARLQQLEGERNDLERRLRESVTNHESSQREASTRLEALGTELAALRRERDELREEVERGTEALTRSSRLLAALEAALEKDS